MKADKIAEAEFRADVSIEDVTKAADGIEA